MKLICRLRISRYTIILLILGRPSPSLTPNGLCTAVHFEESEGNNSATLLYTSDTGHWVYLIQFFHKILAFVICLQTITNKILPQTLTCKISSFSFVHLIYNSSVGTVRYSSFLSQFQLSEIKQSLRKCHIKK